MLQSFRTMLGRLQKLWKSLQPRHMWLGVFALVLVGAFLFMEPTYAQQGVTASVGDWLLRQVAKIMLVVASLAIGLSIFFLRFFIMIASYNNYIDVSVVQLGWVMVRDVANMFFVVALLLIAFGTILGLEEYEWKKNLAKLILSAILINFSNLIAQLCIDVAHVFTITFLNAISATAGGNLINMFKLDQILQLTAVEDPSRLDIELLAAVLPAMLFAIMAAAAIGSYVVVMAARVVALWALIVISPLAFILGVIPQTKSYAEKWWSEFSKYVIVAPIMVFFLWLAFATVGLGSIATEIERGLPDNVKTSGAEQTFGVQRLSMSKVTSWENMANFLIAFAFLMYGIKATQETGTLGSGMIGSAVEFGKKVATIASGYAAGRWLVGKTTDAAKAGTMATADFLVGDYVEMAKNTLAKIPEGYRNWKTMGPQIVRDNQKLIPERKLDQDRDLTDDEKKQGFMIEDRGAQGKFLVQGLTELEQAMGYTIKEVKDKDGKVIERQKDLVGYKVKIKTDADGNVIYKKKADGSFVTDVNGNRVAEGSDKPIYESWWQGKVNRRYQKLLSSRKKLEKVQNDTKLNEEMMDKSIDAQPTHWLSSSEEMQKKDFDRVKRGMLAAMEARSSAKSGQFAAVGEKIVMGSKRFKDGQFQTERGTIAEQIVEHEANTATTKSQLDEITKAARSRFLSTDNGKKLFEGKIKADLEVKAHDAKISNLEAGITTNVALANIAATKESNDKLDKYRAELENSNNLPPEEFYKKQEEVLNKMMNEGLIDKDEYDKISQNQKINQALAGKTGMGKDEALNNLLKSGVIDEKQKKDLEKEVFVVNDRGEPQLQYAFPKQKENVLQRTIAQEKAAHLESEKLSTTQKEEEALFAAGQHGLDEAREAAVLKERTLAAEGIVKKADEVGKALVSGAADDTDNPELKAQREAFAAARLAKIAADKQAHTESQKSATAEKEAELAYTDSKHGRDELKIEEELKARQGAAEGGIKKLEAEAAKTFREEFMSQFGPEMEQIRQKLSSKDAAERASGEEQMNQLWEKMAVSGNPLAKKLASEKQAHTAEAWTKQMEKSMEEVYFAGDHGQHELAEEAEIKAREGLSEAEIKRRTAAAEATFKEGSVGRDILTQSKAAGFQGKASEDEAKKAEALAEAQAALTQKDALYRSQKAQIFSKDAEGTTKQQEATAQMVAGEHFADILESTAGKELEASVRQDRFKRTETAAKKSAFEKNRDALKAQMEIKEQTSAEDAKIKELEATAKTEAATTSDLFKAAQARRIAADKTTQFEGDKVKTLEKAAEQTYQSGGVGKVQTEAKAVLAARNASLDSLIKDLENEAKNKLMSGEFDRSGRPDVLGGVISADDFSYEDTLRDQTQSQIFQNAIGSIENKLKNSMNGKLMGKANDDEDQANRLFDEADAIHSIEAENKVAEVSELEQKKRDLVAEKNTLKSAVENLLKDKKAAADQRQALEARRALAEKNGEAAEFISQLATQINNLKKPESFDNDINTATENLKSFDADANKGVLLEALGDTIKKEIKKIQELDKKYLTPEKVAEQTRLREQAKLIRDKNKAWQYAAAKALEEVSNVDYQVKHNTLLSNVEQVVVHDKRGIQTPTSALTMAIEHYGKTYNDKTYEQFVGSLGSSLEKLTSRRKATAEAQGKLKTETNPLEVEKLKKIIAENEITDDDKAAYAGLLIKGQKENWIDDAIWKYMQSSMGPELTKELGWKDQIFDNKKINDIMALFASGANMEFAKVNSYVSDMMDVATSDLNLGIDEFLDKLKNGTFSEREQNVLTSKVQKNRSEEYNLQTEQSIIQDLFKKNSALAQVYMDETDKNQAQIQLISGFRDKAAGSSHPENGGHAKFIRTKDGKFREVIIGQKMAEKNVLGEVKKMGVGVRAAMQSHASLKIDEASGFVTGIREESYGTVRSGINSANDHRGTNERFMLHSAGLGSFEAKEDYVSDDGFEITGKKADGSMSARHKWIISEGGSHEVQMQKRSLEEVQKSNNGVAVTADGKAITEQGAVERQITTNDVVNNIFAGALLKNAPDFLLSMGKLAGVKDNEALDGKMKLKLLVYGKERVITNVNDLITLYNAGAFSWGKNKPKNLIPKYNPKAATEGAGGKGGKSNDGNAGGSSGPDTGGPESTPPAPKPRSKRSKSS